MSKSPIARLRRARSSTIKSRLAQARSRGGRYTPGMRNAWGLLGHPSNSMPIEPSRRGESGPGVSGAGCALFCFSVFQIESEDRSPTPSLGQQHRSMSLDGREWSEALGTLPPMCSVPTNSPLCTDGHCAGLTGACQRHIQR